MKTFSIEPIGVIRSEIKSREDAPLFYTEGAPNAFLEILPAYIEGLDRMRVGDEIIVITWLHLAQGRAKGSPQNGPIQSSYRYSRLDPQIVRTPWGFTARRFWK
jgi:tRNA (Thr-GGU) A37 N-methylase